MPTLKELLPGEMLEDASIKPFAEKEPAELAKAFLETKKFVGSAIQAPKGPEDVDGWNKALDRLGLPKEASAYGEAASDFDKGLFELAAKHRTPEKFIKEASEYIQKTKSSLLENSEKELANEWGQEYEKNREIAKRGVDNMDVPIREAYEALSKYDPKGAAKLAFSVGKAHAPESPGKFGLPPAMTTATAAVRYRELMPKVASNDRLAIAESKELLRFLQENNAMHLA